MIDRRIEFADIGTTAHGVDAGDVAGGELLEQASFEHRLHFHRIAPYFNKTVEIVCRTCSLEATGLEGEEFATVRIDQAEDKFLRKAVERTLYITFQPFFRQFRLDERIFRKAVVARPGMENFHRRLKIFFRRQKFYRTSCFLAY